MKLEAIKKLGARLRAGFGRFAPFNLVAIAVAALMVLQNHSVLSSTIASNLVRGLYWGALAGVVCRLDGERRASRWRQIAAWPVTLLVGALGYWFWFSTVEGSPHYLPWVMVYTGTFIAFVAIGVALLYRIADEKTLVSKLVLCAFCVFGSAMIFIGSIELCVLAFDKLVARVYHDLYMDVFIASYLTLIPVGFASLLPSRETREDGSDKATAFLFWLLLPASLILLAILYLYLGRIVVTRTMPSGELNWFGSIALAIYVFFWLALRDSTRAFFRRFVRWGWALLIPVLAAQIVGIAIRYNAYGLSAPRFAGMITLMIGIFALGLAAFNRRPRILFVFIAIMGLVFTVTPLNFVDVPIRNQESRLLAALARNGVVLGGDLNSPLKEALARNGVALGGDLKPPHPIFEEDAAVIAGAWNYLEDASSVYYHSKVVATIKEKLGKESLFTRLGLDESKLPAKPYRGYDSKRYSTVTVKARKEEMQGIPVGTFTHVRAAGYLGVAMRDGRYFLSLMEAHVRDRRNNKEFDVTEHVTRLMDAAKWDGVIPPEDTTYEVPSTNLVWELRPGLALGLGELIIHARRDKSFESCSIYNGIILSK